MGMTVSLALHLIIDKPVSPFFRYPAYNGRRQPGNRANAQTSKAAGQEASENTRLRL